ncbi:hypothetical protein [Sphingopyxis sp. Geo25]|nr:hypothetical protein [Sphingopyxis sp. Geo25]
MFRDTGKLDALYDRALRIQSGLKNGNCQPLFNALACRGYQHGQVVHACDFAMDGTGFSHPAFAPYWYRRAWRSGNASAAQHMAMDCFARNNLQGYRLWLGRAARLGDKDAAYELSKFATRLPYRRLRAIKRFRPAYQRKQGASIEMW